MLILVGALLVLRINGHIYVYFWTDTPWWENRALPTLILVFVILLSLFSYQLMNKRIVVKFFNQIIRFNVISCLLLLVFTIFIPANWVIKTVTAVGLLNILAIFLASIYEVLHGEKENTYFITASYFFFIGVLLHLFRFFDIIEIHSFLGTYGFEVGFIAFITFATISLQVRRNLLT